MDGGQPRHIPTMISPITLRPGTHSANRHRLPATTPAVTPPAGGGAAAIGTFRPHDRPLRVRDPAPDSAMLMVRQGATAPWPSRSEPYDELLGHHPVDLLVHAPVRLDLAAHHDLRRHLPGPRAVRMG